MNILRDILLLRQWAVMSIEIRVLDDDQTRDRRLDFRRMQVASDQITLLVESSDDITQDSEVFVPVRIILDSVSLTRSDIHE